MVIWASLKFYFDRHIEHLALYEESVAQLQTIYGTGLCYTVPTRSFIYLFSVFFLFFFFSLFRFLFSMKICWRELVRMYVILTTL
jgi:hypothetical protein